MIAKVYFSAFLFGSLFSFCCLGQKAFRIVQDSASYRLISIPVSSDQKSARVAAHEIQISISPNASKPESNANIHLVFGASVDIEAVSSIQFTVRRPCVEPCITQSVADVSLSPKAINKTDRYIDYVISGLMPASPYTLQTIVNGLDGDACTGSQLDLVNFQTAAASPSKPVKMLLVINNEWQNDAAVQAALDQYIGDVQQENPLLTVEKYYAAYSNAARVALYQYIKDQYRDNNLNYLFFIGDNAAISLVTLILDNNDNVVNTFSTVSFTKYTLPLYDTYTYNSVSDQFETTRYQDLCFRHPVEKREAVFQQINSAISMGAVVPSMSYNPEKRNTSIINYFTKLHKYRNEEISFDKKVLLTDGFASELGAVSLAEGNGWTAETVAFGREKDLDYSGEDPVWKADFLNKLGTNSYEIYTANLHGSPSYQSFGIYKEDINNLPQLNSQLVSLSSCNMGVFRGWDYLAGQYLDKGNVLNVRGYSDILMLFTSPGESALEQYFRQYGAFTLMSKGYNVSDGFRLSESYTDAEVIFGDPLVKFRSSDPLPVVLEKFELQKQEGTVQLSWTTTSEINSDKFEIERGFDGKKWTKIAAVPASADSLKKSNYLYIDQKPLPGQSFYRLKMVDKDGSFTYSAKKSITINVASTLGIYPNPVQDRLFFPARIIDQLKEISIFNVQGQRVYNSATISKNGVSVSQLTPGLFTVRMLHLDGTIQTQKIVVSK